MEKPNGGGSRPVGNTEHSLCSAVPGGTGIAVLAILLSKKPDLQNALDKLQRSHPVLSSKLRYMKSTNSYHFVSQTSPTVQMNPFGLDVFRSIADDARRKYDRPAQPSPIHLILEHELNVNSWNHLDDIGKEEENVMHGSLYELPEGKWAVALRLHVAVCDRRTAVSVLEELLVLVARMDEHEVTNKKARLIGPSIEGFIPIEKKLRKTPFESGVNLIKYWWSFLWQNNLKFDNADSPRASRVVRLKLSVEHTSKILSECKEKQIKLCGVLAASALLAAYKDEAQVVSNKKPSEKTYGVVTQVDCRSILQPPLSQHDLGFYHSAILNTHHVKGGESLWDTATEAYSAFQSSKDEKKHLVDMPNLNLLLCKATNKPGSSLRTSLLLVFEDPVIDDSSDARNRLGVEDYMGCESVHGIGPSLAIFDTVRDGSLDCVCVFPAHLHSPKRMQDFAKWMEEALIEAANLSKKKNRSSS